MAQTLPFVVIDTMTSTPFTGNATPVFILDHLGKWLPEQSMQLIARELNHSETAFLLHSNGTKNTYKIRWFTPHAEEPFCGHGILAAAQALHTTYNDIMEFSFVTHTGIKASATILPPPSNTTSSNENEKLTKILMQFPSSPILPTIQFLDNVRNDFANALGIDEDLILAIGQNSLMDIIIEVDPDLDFSASNMSIDAVALLRASPVGTRSQVITSSWNLDGDVDFAKRVFAYGSEDQATGSTYCALVPYWGSKLGKSDLRAIQPSLRGGKANLEWKRAGGFVGIKADCVKTIEGHIIVPIVYNKVIKPKL